MLKPIYVVVVNHDRQSLLGFLFIHTCLVQINVVVVHDRVFFLESQSIHFLGLGCNINLKWFGFASTTFSLELGIESLQW